MKGQIMGEGMSETVRIYLFCCLTDFNPDDICGVFNQETEITVIPLPCSGKTDILYLTKTFEKGADGVVILTCKEGECRYLEGNLRARKRVEAVEKLLEEIGLGSGRITNIQIDDSGVEKVIRELKNFRQKIAALPRQIPVVGVPS
jgi:F420-non-reducing hydrogenase iron-sulfur subunit